MTTQHTHEPEPNWDEIFNNPAILEVIDGCPANAAKYHDENEDERILENMKRRAPWLNQIMREVIAETDNVS